MSGTNRHIARLESIDVPKSLMNKFIMNYLIKEGHMEAAKKFQEESGEELVGEQVNLNSLAIRSKIRQMLKDRLPTTEVIKFINLHYPDLLDENRDLHFVMHHLCVIEFIRDNKVEEALEWTQTHLAEGGESNPSLLPVLEKTLSLLIFKDPAESPFADLLSDEHINDVASDLGYAILKADFSPDSDPPSIRSLFAFIKWSQNLLENKERSFYKLTCTNPIEFDEYTPEIEEW